MVDAYTKFILTIIAAALLWLGVQPMVKPQAVAADEPVRVRVVRVDDEVTVKGKGVFGRVVVECESGCK